MKPAKFLDPLIGEFLDDGTWKLFRNFDYHLGSPDGRQRVIVEIGFVTDFASVPRMLHPVLPPTGRYGKAAVVHDWLYRTRQVNVMSISGIMEWKRQITRAEADKIFLEGMQVLGVNRCARILMYLGVRLGGWISWRRYRRKEQVVG